MPCVVDEERFERVVKGKMGGAWERALSVFRNCGPHLSFDVTNVMLHAADRGKVDEVLRMLEEHYERHLQYQHPEIRGMVSDAFGVSATQRVFQSIRQVTLGLELIG
jgi:hypothetical protein